LKVFSAAWTKSATVENAMSGFCATGIFPLNRNKITLEADIHDTDEDVTGEFLNLSIVTIT